MTDATLVTDIERDIAPILEEWRAWTEAYSNEIDQSDALYWYNERATDAAS